MPRLSWSGARWELITRSKSEWEDAKANGFHYDWARKLAWTGLTECAAKYRQYADSTALAKFAQVDQLIAASKATSANIVIRSPQGLTYKPFQLAAIQFALERPNTLVADDPGLGKTIEAAGIFDADPYAKTMLVICPASLQINWERELMKWLTKECTGDYASSTRIPDSDIVIVNYEKVWNLREQIFARDFDVITLDESHFCKNEESKRTQAVFGLPEKKIRPLEAKRRRLALTGTPIINRPVELWPMLRNFDPEGLGCNFWLFAKRFCGGADQPSGLRDFSGATNLDVLQDRLRASIMIRRRKQDVLTELPPKRRQIIPLPVPREVAGIVRAELDYYDQHRPELDEAVARAEADQSIGDRLSFDQASSDLKDCNGVIFERMAELRKATGIAKIPYAIQHIENKLQETEKVVVWCHHHEVTAPIAEYFGSIVVQHHGDMSLTQRQLSVDRFENDPNIRIWLGGITTAIGYTILKGIYQVFIEEDWRSTILTQTEDRAHRIGQQFPLLIQHLLFDGSLDARMIKRAVEKQAIIDAAIG